jgi:hypothetical protein
MFFIICVWRLSKKVQKRCNGRKIFRPCAFLTVPYIRGSLRKPHVEPQCLRLDDTIHYIINATKNNTPLPRTLSRKTGVFLICSVCQFTAQSSAKRTLRNDGEIDRCYALLNGLNAGISRCLSVIFMRCAIFVPNR